MIFLKTITPESIALVKEYIKKSWLILERSNLHILQAMNDPKVPENLRKNKILYISDKENLADVSHKLSRLLPENEFSQLSIQRIVFRKITLIY